jgi:hypothetical protein
MASSGVTVDAAALADKAARYVAVGQEITDLVNQSMAQIASFDDALGQGDASALFLVQYRPSETKAREELPKAGPVLHDLAQSVYDWANSYPLTDESMT